MLSGYALWNTLGGGGGGGSGFSGMGMVEQWNNGPLSIVCLLATIFCGLIVFSLPTFIVYFCHTLFECWQ